MKQSTCALPNCGRPCHPSFQYCGLAHGQLHQQQLKKSQSMQQSSLSVTGVPSWFGQFFGGPSRKCLKNGCDKIASSGFDYCCKAHAQIAQQILPSQKVFPKDVLVMTKSNDFTQSEIDSLQKKCSNIGLVLLYDVTNWNDITSRILCFLTPDPTSIVPITLIPEVREKIHWRVNGTNKPLHAILSEIQDCFTKTVLLIHFYNSHECFYEFTNFYERPIKLNGSEWPTTEHFFQAQKMVDLVQQDYVRRFKTPREAFTYARSNAITEHWEIIKIQVMLQAVYAKFSQHDDLRQLLLATGNAELVEHTENDFFWGDGGDGTGQNILGKILIAVRDELSNSGKNNKYLSMIFREQTNQPSSTVVQALMVPTSSQQKFHLIHESSGLVLTVLDDGRVDLFVGLDGASHEWNIHSNGLIESVKYSGCVLALAPRGIILQKRDESNMNQKWNVGSTIESQSTKFVIAVDNKSGIFLDYATNLKDQRWKVTEITQS